MPRPEHQETLFIPDVVFLVHDRRPFHGTPAVSKHPESDVDIMCPHRAPIPCLSIRTSAVACSEVRQINTDCDSLTAMMRGRIFASHALLRGWRRMIRSP